jgi:hypothetical protein
MAVQIQHRRDTAANWASSNPVLAVGEMGIETDTKYFKIGDGAAIWTNLPYGGMAATSPIIGTGINTSSTTFNIVNTTATTINLGGAATTLNLGASTGSFSVGNPNLFINGANPAIRSTNTGAASIFPTNVSSITIGASGIDTTVAGSLKLAGISLGTPSPGEFEYDGSHLYFTQDTAATASIYGGRGIVEVSGIQILDTTKSLNATATTAQAMFNTAAFAVQANTTYLVDMLVSWTSGATTHTTTISFVGGGSVTFTSSALHTKYQLAAAGTAAAISAVTTNGTTGNPASSALATTTTTAGTAHVTGIIRINASPSGLGTIQPSITFSAATGGTPTILLGSYVKLTPIGPGSSALIGAWA